MVVERWLVFVWAFLTAHFGDKVAALTCPDSAPDFMDLHVQLLIAYDMAAFDNGEYMKISPFLRIATRNHLATSRFGAIESSLIAFGDVGTEGKQQCAHVVSPISIVDGTSAYAFKFFSGQGDAHWLRSSAEGNVLNVLRYAMRDPGWLKGEVDDLGRKIVQIILVISDVAGTVGSDESNLGDPADCDNVGYPSMHAVSEDQKNFLPNGIFLFLGGADYPVVVRDAVDAFNTETLPYFLNGARGIAERIPVTADDGVIDHLIYDLINKAACGAIPTNPSAAPPPNSFPTKGQTTTTTREPPVDFTVCPDGRDFDDVHLQLVFAVDMAAFDGYSPARDLLHVRGDVLASMLAADQAFSTAEIALYLYSDKGVSNGKCADERFGLIPSRDAVLRTAEMFTGVGWSTVWERQYESEGSMWIVFKDIASMGNWIKTETDENGKRVVQVVFTYSDVFGSYGTDGSYLDTDPSQCEEFDYPEEGRPDVFVKSRIPNSWFFYIGDVDQPHAIRDPVALFNRDFTPKGWAERLAPSGAHKAQTWALLKHAVCS